MEDVHVFKQGKYDKIRIAYQYLNSFGFDSIFDTKELSVIDVKKAFDEKIKVGFSDNISYISTLFGKKNANKPGNGTGTGARPRITSRK